MPQAPFGGEKTHAELSSDDVEVCGYGSELQLKSKFPPGERENKRGSSSALNFRLGAVFGLLQVTLESSGDTKVIKMHNYFAVVTMINHKLVATL